MRIESLTASTLADAAAASGTIIAALGYEARAASALGLVEKGQAGTRRLALAFNSHRATLSRPQNDEVFRQRGFRALHCDGEDGQTAAEAAREAIRHATATGSAMAVDISSMTRVWYGAMVREMARARGGRGFDTYFIYTPAKFGPPPDQQVPNNVVSPLPGFSSYSSPDLPIALVLGLGYEPGRALGLVELLDPKRTVLLAPKRSDRDPFYVEVVASNREVYDRTDPSWCFEYPMGNAPAIFRLMQSVCGGLGLTTRVVIASLGPKIFCLTSLLFACVEPDVSIWRVSSGRGGTPRDAEPDTAKTEVIRVRWRDELSGPTAKPQY